MWHDISVATTRLAIRRLFAIYLAVAGIALFFPHRSAAWPLLLAFHIAGIVLLLRPQVVDPIARGFPATTRVIGDWYPLLLIPALYTELATLNFAVFNGRYFDPIIQGWEQQIFHGQPSRDLWRAFPFLPLSEYLHFAYLSYYLIIYVPPLYLYLRGRREEQQKLTFNLMLAFFAHYLFFIYFPVQGPRYLFAAPGAPVSKGFFYGLAHRLLESGSSRGAAFPSSHVGVSFAQTAFAFVAAKGLAPVLLVMSTSLAVGAVYGGFHYGTDALCGFAFGLVLFAIAPRVARLLGRGADQR